MFVASEQTLGALGVGHDMIWKALVRSRDALSSQIAGPVGGERRLRFFGRSLGRSRPPSRWGDGRAW